MSYVRIFVWQCDDCGVRETKHDYGFPPGWCYVPPHPLGAARGSTFVTHRCGDCVPDEPRALPAMRSVARSTPTRTRTT